MAVGWMTGVGTSVGMAGVGLAGGDDSVTYTIYVVGVGSTSCAEHAASIPPIRIRSGKTNRLMRRCQPQEPLDVTVGRPRSWAYSHITIAPTTNPPMWAK